MTNLKRPSLLDPFLSPRSVVIVGLSRSAIGSPVSVHTTLLDMGYEGGIFIVNPSMASAPGATVCRSISEVPKDVDLAIISVERNLVPTTLEDCARHGIRSAIVITQGFGDADEIGAELQRKIDAIIANTGIRVLGPNTIGLVNSISRFTSSFIEVTPDDLPVGQVSQSGFLMMGHHLVVNEPAGYCQSIDLGNACDIDLIDVLEHYEAAPEIKVIECHAEAIDDGQAFIATASRITRKKPLVVLKAGRTAAGQAAVASHTGAVAGQARISDAAFRQAGVIQADSAEELRSFSKTLATFGTIVGKRVAIMSFSGGGAVLAIDALDRAGLLLANLSAETIQTISSLFPEWMEVKNPLDIWIPVAKDLNHAFPLVMNALLADEGVDAVMCIYCSYNLPKYGRYDASKHIRDLSASSPGKPVVCWSYGQDIEGFTRTIEERRSAIVFPRLDDAARALAILVEQGLRQTAVVESANWLETDTKARKTAADILEKAREEGLRYLFTEAFEIFGAYGLPFVRWVMAHDETDLARKSAGLRAPYCMKIDSPDVVHKSDCGGVALGIGSEDALLQAFRSMRATVATKVPGARLTGVIVQEMAAKGTEVMIGMVRDLSFGPCIVFGTGGIHAEIRDDFAFRIAPVSREAARAMITETVISKILAGARGQANADIEALVDVICKVSQIAVDHPGIQEIDLNPIFVGPSGVSMVDARVILSNESSPRNAHMKFERSSIH